MRQVAMVLLGLLVSGTALAVEQTSATIASEGVGTVEAAPDYVEFWIHYRGNGKSVAESAAKTQGFESALRKELANRKIAPGSLDFSNLAVPSAAKLETFRSARLRFSMVPFKGGDEEVQQFAKLCDAILATAWALQCTVEGPILGVEDTKPVEQAAIARATAKAYVPAEAVATAMSTRIVGIDHVSVEAVTWNKDPHTKAHQPDLKRVTCTAKVKIWYVYATPRGS